MLELEELRLQKLSFERVRVDSKRWLRGEENYKNRG
jgi:hypothetical protein